MIAGNHLPDARMQRDELTSSHGDFMGDYLFRSLARLWTAIMDRVPLGYEDENGFHWRASSGSD